MKICASCDKPMRDEEARAVPKMSPSGAGTMLYIHKVPSRLAAAGVPSRPCLDPVPCHLCINGSLRYRS